MHDELARLIREHPLPPDVAIDRFVAPAGTVIVQ